MYSINKGFDNSVSELYAQSNFLKTKVDGERIYLRVCNDVMQTFSLDVCYGGRELTVCFGIHPICMGLSKLNSGLLKLDEFEKCTFGGWENPQKSISTYGSIFLSIKAQMEKHLFPFFERADNSIAAYYELRRVFMLFETNRLDALKTKHTPDRAEPLRIRLASQGSLNYCALKAGDYEFYLDSMEIMYNHNMQVLAKLEQDGYTPNPEKIKELKGILHTMENRMSIVRSGDKEAISKLIDMQEKKSLKFLESVL